jgi:glutaredoxin
MPSSRQYKVLGFIALLTLLITYYVSSSASATQNSPFYQRTVASLQNVKDSSARQQLLADEKAHAERVERLRKEHDVATEHAEKARQIASGGAGADEANANVKVAAQPGAHKTKASVGVSGPGVGAAGKIVEHKPAESDDGVAKVGNVEPKKSPAVHIAEKETEDEHATEERLNHILKQGPIIVFSKSYCPYSKKAKVSHPTIIPPKSNSTNPEQHILLDLYTISPAPYIVELDQEPHGQALQDALQRATGRRTVPNVLINGKSIGGGDEIQALHEEGKLAGKVQSMGGKRVVSVVKKEGAAAEGGKPEVRNVRRAFKA